MTEIERQLAYIEQQLARGDREAADVDLLRKRRDSLLAQANGRHTMPTPVIEPHPNEAQVIAKAMAKAARSAAEGGA